MANTENTPTTVETTVSSEMQNGEVKVEDTKESPQVTVEVKAENKPVDAEPIEKEIPLDEKDPKITYVKLRDEVSNARRSEREAREKLDELEKTVSELKTKELTRNEDWKTLYENQTQELVLAKTNNSTLEARVKESDKNSSETVSEVENDLNEALDLLIESWPESAKKLVDPADKASARQRKDQLKRSLPLVKDFFNLNKGANGLPASPAEKKEDDDSKRDRINASLNRLGV